MTQPIISAYKQLDNEIRKNTVRDGKQGPYLTRLRYCYERGYLYLYSKRPLKLPQILSSLFECIFKSTDTCRRSVSVMSSIYVLVMSSIYVLVRIYLLIMS